MEQLTYLAELYRAQASWHYDQYQKFVYYARYYDYLNQCNHGNKNGFFETFKNIEQPEMANVDGLCTLSSNMHIKSKKRKKKKKRSKECVSTCESNVESEFELGDDFKAFLKQSAEFRQQRDAKKLSSEITNTENKKNLDADEEESVEYVDVMRKGPDGTILPPTASNRKKLYEDIYGDLGTTILSLETALQWKFNKLMDNTSPKPWPGLPLRFTWESNA